MSLKNQGKNSDLIAQNTTKYNYNNYQIGTQFIFLFVQYVFFFPSEIGYISKNFQEDNKVYDNKFNVYTVSKTQTNTS